MTETLKIQIPIYREVLHVFFGSIEECIEAQRKDGCKEIDIEEWRRHIEDKNPDGEYSLSNDTYHLIWQECTPETILEYSTLVHEIEHAVFYILDSRGLKHTEESDEAYAYLFGFLFCEIDNYIVDEREKKEQESNNQ